MKKCFPHYFAWNKDGEKQENKKVYIMSFPFNTFATENKTEPSILMEHHWDKIEKLEYFEVILMSDGKQVAEVGARIAEAGTE